MYGKGNRWKVVALDCGIKVNILRSLVQRDCEVTLLPWDAPLVERMRSADGLFLSNGPGDPAMVAETIGHIKEVRRRRGRNRRALSASSAAPSAYPRRSLSASNASPSASPRLSPAPSPLR